MNTWTDVEHEKFIHALEQYGTEEESLQPSSAWHCIAQHVGSRHAGEVREHAEAYFVRLQRHESLEDHHHHHHPEMMEEQEEEPATSFSISRPKVNKHWTMQDNQAFEIQLALQIDAPFVDWTRFHMALPHKTTQEVWAQYQRLIRDVALVFRGE